MGKNQKDTKAEYEDRVRKGTITVVILPVLCGSMCFEIIRNAMSITATCKGTTAQRGIKNRRILGHYNLSESTPTAGRCKGYWHAKAWPQVRGMDSGWPGTELHTANGKCVD